MKTTKTTESDISKTLGIDRSSGRRKNRKRWIVFSAAALVVVVVVIFLISGDNANSTQYITEDAKLGSFVVTVTATGTLEPTNQVDVGSELSGIVKSVEVDFNDLVKVGQVLAKLDPSKLEAQVQQSKSALESARAHVQEAQATVKEMQSQLERLERARELSGNKVPSQQDLDTAEAALQRAMAAEASAKAQVSESEATLKLQQTDLGKLVIRSPIDGIVLARDVEPGQTVAASFQAPVLFTLAENLIQMELHVDVDEADVGKVKEEQEATFTVDAYQDRTFPARITQVRYGSQTIDGVVTYETVLSVDNSDLLLRPGMTATADIKVLQIEDAVLVPNSALRFSPQMMGMKSASREGNIVSQLMPGPPPRQERQREDNASGGSQQVVWTVRGGDLVPISIKIGSTNGTMTEVLEGDLEPGTALVVDVERKD